MVERRLTIPACSAGCRWVRTECQGADAVVEDPSPSGLVARGGVAIGWS